MNEADTALPPEVLQREMARLRERLARTFEQEAQLAEEREQIKRKLTLVMRLLDEAAEPDTIGGESAGSEVVGLPEKEAPLRGSLVGLPLPEATYRVLAHEEEPLHVAEIEERLKDGGYRFDTATPRNSITAALSRDPRFRRVSPGTYEVGNPSDSWDDEFWSQVIRLLLDAEKLLPWVGLKYFRNTWVPQVLGANDTEATRRHLVAEGIGRGYIETLQVENPQNPEFPTTALKANTKNNLVREVMKT